jgi:hypothetical protein
LLLFEHPKSGWWQEQITPEMILYLKHDCDDQEEVHVLNPGCSMPKEGAPESVVRSTHPKVFEPFPHWLAAGSQLDYLALIYFGVGNVSAITTTFISL